MTVANAALFAGALITAMATFLSVRYSDKLEKLKDRDYARLHMQDQQKIFEANAGALLPTQMPWRPEGILEDPLYGNGDWKAGIGRPLYLAGWHLTDNEVAAFARPPYGILLLVPEQVRHDPSTLGLAAALREAKIDCAIDIVSSGELRLIVGIKSSPVVTSGIPMNVLQY